MRVIHVAPTPFGPNGLYGGGERYPFELARALATEIECEVVTFGRQDYEVREPGGLRIRCLRASAFVGGHPAHALARRLPLALSGADIIHTHHMRSAPSPIAALVARLRRQHLVVTDHGLQGTSWGGVLPRLFERFLMVSDYSARELQTPPARTRLIYGGADPERYAPDPSAGRRGVLFVGRITPHKGLDRLIEALPEEAPLMIAGSAGHDPHPPESAYPAYVRRLAVGRKVTFLGAVADDDLPALYRDAAVLVLPSVQRTCYGRAIRVSELLGLVVLEAMASGTPVIGSNLGGLPEIIQHGTTGFLVEPGDAGELRERLREILGDPGLAARMGRNARALVLELFTWRACADRCLRAYAELVSSGPSQTANAWGDSHT